MISRRWMPGSRCSWITLHVKSTRRWPSSTTLALTIPTATKFIPTHDRALQEAPTAWLTPAIPKMIAMAEVKIDNLDTVVIAMARRKGASLLNLPKGFNRQMIPTDCIGFTSFFNWYKFGIDAFLFFFFFFFFFFFLHLFNDFSALERFFCFLSSFPFVLFTVSFLLSYRADFVSPSLGLECYR